MHRQVDADDLIQPGGGAEERLATVREEPRSVVVSLDVMGEAPKVVRCDCLVETFSRARRVVRRSPHAVNVSKLIQPISEATHAVLNVVVVVRIVVDARGNQDGLFDAALVHFEQQLLDRRSAVRIRYRWLVRPVAPRMAVRIDNHAADLPTAARPTMRSPTSLTADSSQTSSRPGVRCLYTSSRFVETLGAGVVLGVAAPTLRAPVGSAAPASNAAAAAPGTLVIGLVAEPTSLDPGQLTDINSMMLLGAMYDTLVRFKPDSFDLAPSLATLQRA